MDNQFVRAPGPVSKDPELKAPAVITHNNALENPPLAEKPIPVEQAETPDETITPREPTINPKPKFWNRRKLTILVSAAVLLLIAGGFAYWHFRPHHITLKSTIAHVIQTTPGPLTVASKLSGLQVNPDVNTLPITAVMIENSIDARPQSGLSEAGVVFEALAEGGITRFVALYQGNDTANIGPIRSARPYFISWMLGFDADYAHVGGSPEALSDIKSWGVKDMDEFYNASAYQRLNTRIAPHNVYTSLANLTKLEQTKNYTSSSFTSWPRKAGKALAVPTATAISLTMSSYSYNVSYSYVPLTNSYNRDVGGVPQVDSNTSKQLIPNVVIAMVVPESNGPLDGIGAYYSEYQTIGSGTALIFQDGGVTEGQWTKSSNTSNVQFTTSAGQALPLNPGQVWITAIPSNSAVSYH